MKQLQFVFIALAVLCFAIPAFADGGSAALNLVPIGAGLGMGLAAGLCGLGQGKAVGSAVEAVARNPGRALAIFTVFGSWSRSDRVPHPVHPGYCVCQGEVGFWQYEAAPLAMGGAVLRLWVDRFYRLALPESVGPARIIWMACM